MFLHSKQADRWRVWVLFIWVAFALASCHSSSKHLTYMRDIQSNKTLSGLPLPSPDYKVKADDNLYVSIISSNQEMNELYNPAQANSNKTFNNVNYNMVAGQYLYGFRVDSEGYLKLPLLGKIQVAGKNINECEEAVQARAEEYLKTVTAKVRLLNHRVSILGEVRQPGVYYNYDYQFTVLDAIGMAGGTTNSAKLTTILVIRADESGSQTYQINLRSSTALGSPGYYLQPNDVVVVKPSKYKGVELKTPLISLLLSLASTTLLLLNFLE